MSKPANQNLNSNQMNNSNRFNYDENSLNDDFEIQSVIPENEQESIEAALSTMTSEEMVKMEHEVKLIQNNVRSWLLRKNYINLREAVKTLQGAWRGKRNNNSNLTPKTKSFKRMDNYLNADSHSNPQSQMDFNDSAVAAAIVLQSHARGRLARQSFQAVRKQAIASVLIQRSVLNWWKSK